MCLRTSNIKSCPSETDNDWQRQLNGCCSTRCILLAPHPWKRSRDTAPGACKFEGLHTNRCIRSLCPITSAKVKARRIPLRSRQTWSQPWRAISCPPFRTLRFWSRWQTWSVGVQQHLASPSNWSKELTWEQIASRIWNELWVQGPDAPCTSKVFWFWSISWNDTPTFVS